MVEEQRITTMPSFTYLKAVFRDEKIISENDLYDIVVVDLLATHPDIPQTEWVVYSAGVEIPIPRGSSDSEVEVRVRAFIKEMVDDTENPPAPPPDTRRRTALGRPNLLGVMISREPPA